MGSGAGDRLSGRELEVLKMAARGKTNARIADALAISAATVKRHLANSYEKLGVGTRGEAVARGLAKGWIGPWELLPPAEAEADERGAGARYRCADEFCGCEVVVVRPTSATSWRPPECHGRGMVRVGPRD